MYDAEYENPTKLLGTYTNGNLGSIKLTAYSGAMYIIFESNGAAVDSGFAATYTSILDTSKKVAANFDADSIYYKSTPFKIKNKSKIYSGDPIFYWEIDGSPILNGDEKDFMYSFSETGLYNIKLSINECDIFDTLSKNVKVVMPNSPTNINFKASENYTSKGRKVNLYALTDKANRFVWEFSPKSYFLNNPPASPSFYSSGKITYKATPGDSIPMPIIEFLDTVCYTISLTAYNSYDSAATTNFLQKTDYICGKFYKNYFNTYGRVYNDLNNNCILDSTDDKVINFPIIIKDSVGNFISTIYTLQDGMFATNLPDKKYNISLDTLGLNVAIKCNTPGIDSMVNKWKNGNLSDVDFAVNCNSKSNLEILSVNTKGAIFPGRKHNLLASIGNRLKINCNSNIKLLKFKIIINGKVTFVSTETNFDAPTSINANTYSFDLSAKPELNNDFLLIFKTDTNATVTDTIKAHLELTYLNNSDTIKIKMDFKYPVTNSYDPNIKDVYPMNVAPGFNDWLTYTVQFQNLGNAPAYNIRIADTLDNLLNPETYRVLAQSHTVNTTLNKNIISFKFNDIMLPDSASDPKGSVGFVQYKIKPYSPLAKGDKIKNTAYIYFDYNPAVVTNTTQNKCVQSSNSVIQTVNNTMFKVYPNPSKGVFTIESNAKIYSQFLIYDIYGKLLKKIAIKSQSTIVDIQELANGIYFVKLNNNSNNAVIIIKE